MKAHVNAVQALGFRYILWVSAYMVGDESQAAQTYALPKNHTSLKREFNFMPDTPSDRF